MWYMLNVNENILNKNNNMEICKRAKNTLRKFHTQILQLWSEVHNTRPVSKNDILNEYLLYNKNILINRKVLEHIFFGKNCNVNIKLIDIYLQNGEIMSKAKVDKDTRS